MESSFYFFPYAGDGGTMYICITQERRRSYVVAVFYFFSIREFYWYIHN